MGLAGRRLAAYALRRERNAPLLGSDGGPVALPRVLTQEERRAA